MSLETDLLLDRRRLKRRLIFWRTLAVAALVVAGLVGIEKLGFAPSGARIARVSVKGLITEDRKVTEAIDAVADNNQVKALILSIDSPGGSVAGGETLHDAVARVSARKPVVVTMGGLAASAGYMIAVPAERIFARQSTLTGSIGVLLETGEASGLLEKVGISAQVVRSGPLKDEPSLIRPLSPEGKEALQGLVNDMYGQFVEMVATGRHMDAAKVRSLADGRAYTGRQARDPWFGRRDRRRARSKGLADVGEGLVGVASCHRYHRWRFCRSCTFRPGRNSTPGTVENTDFTKP